MPSKADPSHPGCFWNPDFRSVRPPEPAWALQSWPGQWQPAAAARRITDRADGASDPEAPESPAVLPLSPALVSDDPEAAERSCSVPRPVPRSDEKTEK